MQNKVEPDTERSRRDRRGYWTLVCASGCGWVGVGEQAIEQPNPFGGLF